MQAVLKVITKSKIIVAIKIIEYGLLIAMVVHVSRLAATVV